MLRDFSFVCRQQTGYLIIVKFPLFVTYTLNVTKTLDIVKKFSSLPTYLNVKTKPVIYNYIIGSKNNVHSSNKWFTIVEIDLLLVLNFILSKKLI